MIRNKVIKSITELLNDGYFSSDDFEITSGDERYSNEKLNIKYKYYDYNIQISLPSSISHEDRDAYYKMSGTMSPGHISFKENFDIKNYDGLLQIVKDWRDLVKQELSYQPIIRAMEKQQVEITKLTETINEIDDSTFSDEEIEKLKTHLHDLQRQMEASLTENEKDKEKLKKEIENLKEQFKGLQDTISANSKKQFVRKFASRITTWLKNPNNRALLKDGTLLVKEIIDKSGSQ